MIRVRFAPSPTGFLHLGNIRTALFNYLFVKRQNGKFILRVEDTDRERSKPEFRQGLMEDMLWMGIRWDEGPEVGGDFGPYLQSERLPIYQKHIDKLISEGKAYYCYVTEEETEELKRLAKLERRPPRFDNRGRYFSKEEIESRKARGIKPTVRFKIENPQLKMHDLIRGDVSFNLDEMVGDFVIQRADGQPTFHLAVCIDDGLMQVTHVIRGEDHLSNTPKHILLLRAMGFEPPQYGHLSLIHGPGGEPLSKRLGDVSVKEFRRKGYLPHGLANYIALLGWAPGDNREIFKWEELMQAFDLARVNKSASIYDPHKLDWVNGEHLRALSDEDFSRFALTYLKEQKLLKHDESILHKILPIFKDNIERFDQLADRLEILNENLHYESKDLIQSEEGREVCKTALEILPTITDVGEAIYENLIQALKPRVKAKGKHLFMPLRIAITGKVHGPELKRLFPVFGIEGVKKRLERALNL
ncbi:MAG: glutamate--tRNA ligase [Candidatus Omnitrophica bacterium]|nr:glutamate--tRNA ligase [Candidatus Omnitrophota bacterium]